MLVARHVWVCSICGQGLTRKSTAKRHNNNLHSGKAMLVRPYEYIVGRLNDTFLYNDPSLYRHNKKAETKNVSSSMYSNMLGSATSDSVVHEGMNRHASHNHGTATNGSSKRIYPHYNAALHSYKPPSEARKKPANNMQILLERQVKLKEFQTLAEKVYPPDIARQVMMAANYQATVLGDDASLDNNLELLRIKARQMSY